MKNQSRDIVYVLTNPAMPGLVKIGYTTRDDAKNRIDELYSCGVPVPFEIIYASRVRNAAELEKALHTAFAPQRVNPKREFFKIDPEQAIAILRVFQQSDATDEVSAEPTTIDPESAAAGKQLRKRRPNMNFEEMGIPIGSELFYTNGDAKVTVVGPKQVKMGEQELSLTAATRLVSGVEYDQPPTLYWTFDGKLLREIYEDTYDAID